MRATSVIVGFYVLLMLAMLLIGPSALRSILLVGPLATVGTWIADRLDHRQKMNIVREAGLRPLREEPPGYQRHRIEVTENHALAHSRRELDTLNQSGRQIGYRVEYEMPADSSSLRRWFGLSDPGSSWMTVEMTRYQTLSQASEALDHGESSSLRQQTARPEARSRPRDCHVTVPRPGLAFRQWRWNGRVLRSTAGKEVGRQDYINIFEARSTLEGILVEVTGDRETDVRQTALAIRSQLGPT